MYVSSEAVINQFLRTYPYPFTAEALQEFLIKGKGKISLKDCKDYLETSPFVFELHKGVYITRAGAFTGKKFSFKLTQEEIDKNMFIPGHRFMPFANPETLSFSLNFLFNGASLYKTSKEFDSFSAAKFFLLFGEEYVSQYIAADPANEDLDLASLDFELPQKVWLTGISLEPFQKACGIHYGDRILCELIDWDAGTFSVSPIKTSDHGLKIRKDDVKRQEWYDKLEKYLLEGFDDIGPLNSIEEQLANVFFKHGDELSCEECGSVEELLQRSKKIGFENYGVESRLWRIGEDVPAVGAWNSSFKELSAEDWLPSIDFLIDTYIKDLMYQKKNDTIGLEESLKSLPFEKKEIRDVKQRIENRKAAIAKTYNWFADFVTGAVRHSALKLYREACSLMCDIMSEAVDLEKLPQQELVILTQLYTHLLHMLESLEMTPAYINEESEAMMLSLEGMEFNFYDIRPIIRASVIEQSKKGFKIIGKL